MGHFKGMRKRLMILCLAGLLLAGSEVYAEETDQSASAQAEILTTETSERETSEVHSSVKIGIEPVHWKRRIYDMWCEADDKDLKADSVKVYAGKNYHLVDAKGNVLSEGSYIDADGNVISGTDGGRVSRDRYGWYIGWDKPNLSGWGKHHVYVQADKEFIGGNNQTLGVSGLSGIYSLDEPLEVKYSFDYEDIKVNVASEVDVSDVEFPVLRGIDTKNANFLNKAVIKIESVYGELKNLPIEIQWYRVEKSSEGSEKLIPVGEGQKRPPYYIPESELSILDESPEYRVRVFYVGEASTQEARENTKGYENISSAEKWMDEAVFKVKDITGVIDLMVCLEDLPYNNETSSNNFKYKLYRFDQPNQMIGSDTPYTEYTVSFEKQGNENTQHLFIDQLSAGWYTLVPTEPEGQFEEKIENRVDSCEPKARTGSAAGVDFYIGQIVDTKYSWESIRYQGQNTENERSDNFFRVVYRYKETVYGVQYDMNLPEGVSGKGEVPTDSEKYAVGTSVKVRSGHSMTSDGWKFVGWSLDPGDGIYGTGDEIYSDISVHGIEVKSNVSMVKDGLKLYGQWVPVYTVNYDGNLSTGGNVPLDINGTAGQGTNIYYYEDMVTVLSSGNLEKTDSDGTKYIFDGWSMNQDGSGNRYYEGDKFAMKDANVTLYAQWKAVGTDKYAVNYVVVLPEGAELAGEVPEDDKKYADGNVIKVKGSGTMSVSHYRFAGWSTESREDGLYQQDEVLYGSNDVGDTVHHEEIVMKEQGISFYSRWIPLYQVVYYSNGNVTGDIPKDENEYVKDDMVKILSGDKMIRPGYQFIGWNTKENGSGQSYDPGLKFNMPAENIELYAQWEEVAFPETKPEETEQKEEHERNNMWIMVWIALVAVICIAAYVIIQLILHKKR